MANRTQPDVGDSLDLLLDTISNAFGGILFLTILLTLLLKLSHPKTKEPVSDDARNALAVNSQQLDTLLEEIRALEQATRLQRDTRSRLIDPRSAEQYAEIQKLRKHENELRAEFLDGVKEAASTQQQIDAIGQRIAELDEESRKMGETREKLEHTLAAEKERRTQLMVPPMSRTSTKNEIGLFLRYGRLYQSRIWRPGRIGTPNLEDFVLVKNEDDSLVLTPKPYRGVPINDTDEFADILINKLSGFSPDGWHVCLIVWEDSFEQFAILKKRLVSLGYSVRLIPLPKDGVVSESNVPDPQVQ